MGGLADSAECHRNRAKTLHFSPMNAEQQRLADARNPQTPWKKWGPYLSERQWGTVREDYSENGDAWNYFSHDQARSPAYHSSAELLSHIALIYFSRHHTDLARMLE